MGYYILSNCKVIMKNYLYVFLFLFLSINLSASNITKPVPVKIEKKRKDDVYPYAGLTFIVPSVGVAYRDEKFTREYAVNASSAILVNSLTVSASKLITDKKNFQENGDYVGAYFGVGGGAGVVGGINFGDPPIIVFPVIYAKAFLGRQSKYGFIDFGVSGIPVPAKPYVMGVPTLRFGFRY